jgi:hypothetical protein
MPPITVRSVASPNTLFSGEKTTADLLNGAQVQMPPWDITFKRAERAKTERREQTGLFEETK